MTIEGKVAEIIIKQLGVDGQDIHSNSSFLVDLGADSLDIVEMIMTVEEEFGVEISSTDAESLATVRDLVERLKINIPMHVVNSY